MLKVWISLSGTNLLMMLHINEESSPPESKNATGTSDINLFLQASVSVRLIFSHASSIGVCEGMMYYHEGSYHF